MPGMPLPDYYDDLDATFAHAWSLWVRGGKDRKSAFHTPVVASVTPAGAPETRVMVLRQADMAARTLRFHTDTRSGKIAQLAGNSAVSVIGYDQVHKIQLRLRGAGRIVADGDAADAAWAHTGLPSRKCYLAEVPPGSASPVPTSGLATQWASRDPDLADSEAGRANFAILRVDVDELEWVFLAAAGHRRAKFSWSDGAWTSSWIVP